MRTTKSNGANQWKHPRPEWVLRYLEELKKEKGKNLQVKYVNGSWQVHRYEVRWDPEKKRPEKKTEYIGTIKEDGFHPRKRKYRKRRRKVEGGAKMKVEGSYEYGASKYCKESLRGVYEKLKEEIGEEKAKQVVGMAIVWGMNGYVPLKRIGSVWEDSWISREWEDVSMDSREVSKVLKYIGKRPGARDAVSGYMLMESGSKYVLYDLTHVFTYSGEVRDGEYGWNAEGRYAPQVKVSVVHNGEEVFHMERWGGSYREIKVLRALKERLEGYLKGKKEFILVSDRGIASYQLAEEMGKEGFMFIMPLRKNFSVINYLRKWDDVFSYQDRMIAYSEDKVKIGDEEMRLLIYWDTKLEEKEKQVLLRKYKEGKISREEFEEKVLRSGKIALLTNTDLPPDEVFELYKSRAYIEESIRRFKDGLSMEGTYMRSDEALSGYFFVITLALKCHYDIMRRLREANLLSRYSVYDVLWELRKVRKEPWIDGWHFRPLTKRQKTLFEKLGLLEIIGFN